MAKDARNKSRMYINFGKDRLLRVCLDHELNGVHQELQKGLTAYLEQTAPKSGGRKKTMDRNRHGTSVSFRLGKDRKPLGVSDVPIRLADMQAGYPNHLKEAVETAWTNARQMLGITPSVST